MKENKKTIEEIMREKGIEPEDLDQISIGVIEQLAKQNRKGRKTYGHSLADCPDDKFNWPQMINEELIDALQYYEKEQQRLLKLTREMKEEIEERKYSLTLNEYQDKSKRTAPSPEMDPEYSAKDARANYAMGISGEAGEVTDAIKKEIYHGHSYRQTRIKVMEEIGDVLHYAAGLATMYGFTLQEAAWGNIQKLEDRYPDGFDPKRSQNRIRRRRVPQQAEMNSMAKLASAPGVDAGTAANNIKRTIEASRRPLDRDKTAKKTAEQIKEFAAKQTQESIGAKAPFIRPEITE